MSKNICERDNSYDILRSIVIVNAIILHFDTKFNLSFAAYPFKMIQSCFFTVGAFFFFTAGVMAYAVYVPKFKGNYIKMTKKLFLKGINIYAIYILYLVIMKLALGIKFEGSLIDFLFKHDLFLKVLLTFGTLYIFAPLFIILNDLRRNSVYFLLILTILFYLVLEVVLRENADVKMLLVDRQRFLYPLLPSFMMFFMGMIFSNFEQNSKSIIFETNSLNRNVFYAIAGMLILLSVLNKIYLDKPFFENALFVTLRESLVIVVSVSCTKSLLDYSDRIRDHLEGWKGLCFGVKSLTAYVTGNILIGLISYKFNLLGAKLIILFAILWITYLVSYWNWKADYTSKSLVNSAR